MVRPERKRRQRGKGVRNLFPRPDTFEPEPGSLDHALVVRAGQPKQRLTVRLDADLVDWFKAQGPNYQARINAVLRAYAERARKSTP